MQPFYIYLAFIFKNNCILPKSFPMKNIFFILLFLPQAFLSKAQDARDLFSPDVPVTWLGIDYSHCKLIGNFAEFADAGRKSTWQIRDSYFPKWNAIIMNEPDKYDVRGMLRRGDMGFDLEMISAINAQTPLAEMEVLSPVIYSEEDIRSFVNQYTFKDKNGIGIVFIAESMNKILPEAWYHFVAIDKGTGKVIMHERMRGQPSGVGLRNYWANSIHYVIRNIQEYYYWEWKKRSSSGDINT
jgi:hypothetical protein